MCAVQFKDPTPEPRKGPQILMVGGGKGGVGKSNFSVNLAVEVARRGWRVILLDADLSCANAETLLGFRPDTSLDTFLRSPLPGNGLADVVCDTPFENLRMIPGTSGLLDVSHPRYTRKVALLRALRQLDADLVVVDLDAGAHLTTLDFFRMKGTTGVVVINPERTSIDNAFKFLRAALFRQIEKYYQSPEVGLLLKRNHTLADFFECLEKSTCFDVSMQEKVKTDIKNLAERFQPYVVVNKVNTAYEGQVAANILSKYCRQHLQVEPQLLGHIFFDPIVKESVNCGVPFVHSRPKLQISGCFFDMANRLGYF
jgi:flagellar biosynthesis protein FlhG